MTIRFVVSAAALFGLTACGGGGGSLGGPDLDAGPGTYADLDIEFDRFKSYLTSADSTTFPSDTVNYDGVILMAEDLSTVDAPAGVSASGYLGQVDVDVNFATNNVSGTANNFFDTNLDGFGDPGGTGTTLAGSSLALSGTTTTGNNAFNMTVSGNVDGYTVGGSIPVEFKLGNAQAFVGATPFAAQLTATGGPTPVTGFDAFIGAD